MRPLALVALLTLFCTALVSVASVSRASAQTDAAVEDPPIPDAPAGDTELEDESAPAEDASAPSLDPAEVARSLADPFGLELRARELDAILAADAQSAEQSRTFGAVMGYVIGAIGLGATPVFFALDDGSGLLPILSILPLQLGALSLATAILGSVSVSTEERRYAQWRALASGGRPGLGDIGRYEGFVVADADRARDARLFSMAQGIAGIATGLFTGIVGLAASRVELTQITLGALGAAEILLGALQLVGALDAGDVEARPSRYEARTGVRLSLRVGGLEGTF
jgi:hypothetical protein